MSTSAQILVKQQDGSVSTVYVNWDGYVSYTGMILKHFYNSLDLANQLIAGGEIQQLGIHVGVKHNPMLRDNVKIEGISTVNLAKMTTYYHRDCGEKRLNVNHGLTEDFACEHLDAEYNYLFDGKTWFVFDTDNDSFIEL